MEGTLSTIFSWWFHWYPKISETNASELLHFQRGHLFNQMANLSLAMGPFPTIF